MHKFKYKKYKKEKDPWYIKKLNENFKKYEKEIEDQKKAYPKLKLSQDELKVFSDKFLELLNNPPTKQ